ncbi:MAG TPA: DUF402 domain-containing protein [Pyrinomonadaceae bacterium]|nr:DUF402 domain-containing protein [Pyrinomonadaceae bacterium]
MLDATFDRTVGHELLGTIPQGTLSVEYYWLDRWYNVFRFLGPGGVLRNFYCNINKPPSFDGQILSYIDLDIDILVEPGFSFSVLDLDEFEHNVLRYDYPLEIQINARSAVNELIGLIGARAFPFNN